ncbi:MAG TPA: phenylalanine--tRNA ligase subunit beta [Terriglobia bacterium]
MKILLSWLREFVPFTVEPKQLATDLSQFGLAVDALSAEGEETVLELDVTTNRPDCLSHYGVARELAAFYKLPLAPFGEPPHTRPRPRRKDAMVEIVATDLCGRYSARVIRGVAVGPSPDWLSRRLELVGVRSINNVADATNYVLMAYGHPMHAFDMDRLQGGRILVRRASEGEPLTTLDGVERKLTANDLVIADAKRAVALAGVMGGRDSEISAATKNVLLESAWFDPVAVRKTAKRQGLHTEASHRFERGADIEATLPCADRCIELIRQLAGGEPDPTSADAFPKALSRHPILLRRWELARHLGVEIAPEEAEGILNRLSLFPRAKGRMGWNCIAPSYRVDLNREIDLVEEVARHYGYDRVPGRLPSTLGQAAERSPDAEKEGRVRQLLLSLGYDETVSSPLVSQDTAAFGEDTPVALANPLSAEAAILRTSLVPNLLVAMQWNLNRGQENVALFEIGNTYRRDPDGYREPRVAVFAATGERVASGLEGPGKEWGFFDVKGDVEQAVDLFAVNSYQFDSGTPPNYYRPGHFARLLMEGKTAGRFGQLNPGAAEQWKFRREVFVGEIFLDVLYAFGLRSPQVRPVSRYPSVERDFSVVLPEGRTFEAVRQAVVSLGMAELVGVRPVEIFRGAQVAAGHYSMLLRVTLQSDQGTLTEADLAERSARIIESLERRLGATIRMSG